MGKYTEQELAQKMCEIYVDYYNSKGQIENGLIENEINQQIKDLSNLSNKTISHLKGLLLDYYEDFTQEEQILIGIVKDKIRKNREISILDRLKNMSESEIKEYLKKINAAQIRFKLNEIIKGNDKEQSIEAKKYLERINRISEQQKTKKRQEFKNVKFMQIKEILELMINKCYFSIHHFSKDHYKEFGMEYELFNDTISKYISYIKNNYPKYYNIYKKRLKQNLCITYEQNKEQIEQIILLQDKYDIIDYYLYINLPPRALINLCKHILTDEDCSKVKRFIKKYYEEPSYNPKNEPWIVIPNQIIKGEPVTQETQELILKFMEEHDIPSNFFISCLMKYRNNELDYGKQKIMKNK